MYYFSPPPSQLHTDMDRNDGRTKYVLRGEGAGSVFVIDEKTGNIHVTKPLDREEKDEYRLIATATDRQTDRALEPSSQFIIRVQDINDNPPVFDEGPYSATVPEMANIGGCEVADNIWLISPQASQARPRGKFCRCAVLVCPRRSRTIMGNKVPDGYILKN